MKTPFVELLRTRRTEVAWTTEEILDAVLPLLEQVAEAHDGGLVAFADGADHLRAAGRRLWFENRVLRAPLSAPEALAGAPDGDSGAAAVAPPGYRSWETVRGHHDALSDVYVLGLVLASIGAGLDLGREDDLALFAAHRRNLLHLRPELHPVIAREIAAMTEPQRPRRARDLATVIERLHAWAEDDDAAGDLDLETLDAAAGVDPVEHRRNVLRRLQERLYQISRRNRLLYFRPTLQNIDLTVASVPLGEPPDSFPLDDILVFGSKVAATLERGDPLDLSRLLRLRDAPYASAVLTKIRASSRRDRREFGFSQLRLVLAFLHWHNLKDAPSERIRSPLLLLPVRLVRKKGVQDSWRIEATSAEAEVNPALRHHLRQLYGLELPPAIPATIEAVRSLHADLATRIADSASEVQLELHDRPERSTLLGRARRRLDAYLRRAGVGARPGMKRHRSIAYSYDPAVREPLGIQLFRRYVEPDPLPSLGGAAPSATAGGATSATSTATAAPAESDDAHRWQIDLCRLTLGNFRYRKMSLVGDYDAMIGSEIELPAVEALFSLDPRAPALESPPVPRDDRYPVVPCDATQASAILSARTGSSYLIQGPPGTGKSQTIANLIADFVARGRRVLFVCEKRAAIDVVYHRLRRDGLDLLCCLIHDSQEDKKAFIHDLRRSYESALTPEAATSDATTLDSHDRQSVLETMAFEVELLESYDRQMTSIEEHAGISLRELITRRLATKAGLPRLRAAEMEALPHYVQWNEHRAAAARIVEQLTHLVPGGAWGSHPLARIRAALATASHPIRDIEDLAGRARDALDHMEAALDASGLSEALRSSLTDIDSGCAHALRLEPLARTRNLELLDRGSPASIDLEVLRAEAAVQQAALDTALEATRAWRERLDPEETRRALEQARHLVSVWMPFLRPTWWRLRRVLRRRYDFAVHAVRPDDLSVLAELRREHQARAALEATEAAARDRFQVEGGIAAFTSVLDALREECDEVGASSRSVQESLVAHEEPSTVIEHLRQAAAALADLRTLRARLYAEPEQLDGLEDLREALVEIGTSEESLPDFLPILAEIAGLPPDLQAALRRSDVTVDQAEGLLVEKTLKSIYRSRRGLARLTPAQRSEQLSRLEEAHHAWLEANASWIVERVRHRFREHVAFAARPKEQLEAAEQEKAKLYQAGRRILEHEFGKTRRYKSIRDLMAAESRPVITDLKPVWLMSPLSVSDALPLDAGIFDVVVFDEASQIPLEEAIPPLARAAQSIVVGDEMQLPPTDFFSSRESAEELLLPDDSGQLRSYELDASSFLTHSARSLPSALLGWHYRSRSEALISFSNRAFYGGELMTIPDRHAIGTPAPEIRVEDPSRGRDNAAAVLERSISHHFMDQGVYRGRRNPAEAAYIAELVRGIMLRPERPTIGIVAFSQTQQEEIEGALEEIAVTDTAFSDLLEAEYERSEDDEFAGLLVKNLENMQGDERDVVILSVCYGPDPRGRLRMHFGPINQAGGEKRLNVAFTRAKRHMAVVSSLRPEDITNDYNEGARCLRDYLRYAAAVSRGDLGAAERVLAGLTPPSWGSSSRGDADLITIQIAEALRQRGLLVDHDVGQSRFRCDLAVRRHADHQHRVAVLVDGSAHYGSGDIVARDVHRPAVLRAFGWQVVQVLGQHWDRQPDTVLERIEAAAGT